MLKRFQFAWLPTLLCGFFELVFLWLGVWQLHRYHEKKAILMHFNASLAKAPIPFSELNLRHNPAFSHIQVKGYYLNDWTFLLENHTQNGQAGFEVLTPLVPNSNCGSQVLLINRGWIKEPSYQTLPKIPAVLGMQTQTGYIKFHNEWVFLLGPNIIDTKAHPILMQKIDIPQLEKITHLSFYPFVVRLDPVKNSGFIRNWQPLNMLPERSLGYAIQWFAMAFTLFIAYFVLSCSSNRKDFI